MQYLNFKDNDFIEEILSSDLIIYENVKGNRIYAKYSGGEFIIKTELHGEPINGSDKAIINFYGKALNYLNNLDNRVKSLLNRNSWYVFEYFPEDQPHTYNRLPKNNLILCGIYKANKLLFSVGLIEEYSRLMDVECLPFIFEGKLDDKMKTAIKYFLNTSREDLTYIFGEKSFAFFFYKLLKPQLSRSFLMEDSFNENITNIILKVNDIEEDFSIFNTLYNNKDNSTEYAEVYSLILINFLNFCQSINLKNMRLKGKKRGEIYLSLICLLFNEYIDRVGEDIKQFNFIIPEFFNEEKFLIKKYIIKNKKTIEYIKDPKLEYIFKCIYHSFRYEIKEEIGLLNNNMFEIFNSYIRELNGKIDTYQRKKAEFQLAKSGLVDFGEFFDIKYDKDGDDNVYPEILDKIKKSSNKKKKFKGIKNQL